MAQRAGGGDANDQALAYFLPGVLYNAGYAAVISLTILVRWPVVGFMVGSVAGDPTAWHRDRQVVRLCSNLSWLLVAPCVIRVSVQLPLYLAGTSGAYDPEAAVAALGVSKIVDGLAAPDRRARRDGVAARPQPHPGRPGAGRTHAHLSSSSSRSAGSPRASAVLDGGEQPLELLLESAAVTNSSSSPDSIGCSADGV